MNRSLLPSSVVACPPVATHADNEQAADTLPPTGQRDGQIEWVAVRPDSLLAETTAAPMLSILAVAQRNLDPARPVASMWHFMAELITNDATWQKWRGQMPVIYNQEKSSSA
jgi:hypothetical protein